MGGLQFNLEIIIFFAVKTDKYDDVVAISMKNVVSVKKRLTIMEGLTSCRLVNLAKKQCTPTVSQNKIFIEILRSDHFF